jgi:hydrogenase maturation protease
LTGDLPKILVYGYGNPGRQDDGLGIRFVEAIIQWCNDNQIFHVDADLNYQLNVEDAAGIAGYDLVIFADASHEAIANFRLDHLVPSEKTEFTMHAVSPAFILHLCKQLFNKEPESYLLHIRGYEWEFMEEITDKARANLLEALDHIKDFITAYSRLKV